MNIANVIERYTDRRPNPRARGEVEWQAGNVFCRDRVIYSYGSHFPMAYYLGQQAGEPVYLLNGDRYSNSTSGHQGRVRAKCPGFTVPFTALNAAKVWPSEIKLGDVIERTQDTRIELTRASVEDPWQDSTGARFIVPRVGEVVTYSNPPALEGYFHAPGAVLFKHGRRTLLATSDEGTYCVIELPMRLASVTKAFDCLKPAAVHAAELEGKEVKRQGEWFFIPAVSAPPGRSKARQAALPRRNDAGNLHVVPHLQIGGTLFVKGSVYHRDGRTERASRQHRTLRLDGWHTAHRNTERASWQAQGRVD
jgi:hypothetical protein